MSSLRPLSHIVVVVALLAPTAAHARATYHKMVVTADAATFRKGQLLRPRFSQALRAGKFDVVMGGRTIKSGTAAEQLFADTLAQLRKDGKVDAKTPGRTEGVFVTADLDRFPTFRDDPARSKVTLAPKDPSRVGTYDRRHFLAAIRALDRAQRAGSAQEKARHVATAKAHAVRYYTEAVDLSDPKAEPETLLGGGGVVRNVTLRK